MNIYDDILPTNIRSSKANPLFSVIVVNSLSIRNTCLYPHTLPLSKPWKCLSLSISNMSHELTWIEIEIGRKVFFFFSFFIHKHCTIRMDKSFNDNKGMEEDRWTNNSQSINLVFVDSVMDTASRSVYCMQHVECLNELNELSEDCSIYHLWRVF